MLFKLHNMRMSLDLTTYCNAKCPQCHRTNRWGLGRNEGFPLQHVMMDKFVKAFPPETIKKFKVICLVPTWGDMGMHPEIYDICKYILECHKFNHDFCLQFDTNGSMRDEDFWFKLGGLCRSSGPKLNINFDIDGIDQEMHSMYRRNTDLDKVLRNMEALSLTYAKATSQTILFKHNQPYMKEIKELAKKYGSVYHLFVASERFYPPSLNEHGQYNFTDEDGKEYFLEPADTTVLKNASISHLRDDDYATMKDKVVCRWANDNKININFDGQVWPCCYFGYSDIGSDSPDHQRRFYDNDLIQKYNENRLGNNVYFTPLEEILRNDWWVKHLPESIEKSPISQCTRNCSFTSELSVQQWRTLEAS